jgi:hypothetical protein
MSCGGRCGSTQLHNQQDTVDHNRDESPPLPLGQILLRCAPDRNDQVTPLGAMGRADPESVGQPLPVRGVQGISGSLAEMPAKLAGHLQDRELAGPTL